MSLKTMIRKAHTKCDIKSLSTSKGAGGKLTKTWSMRYHDVPCRMNAEMSQAEILRYQKASIFPDFIMYTLYRSGIEITDRVIFKSRTFDIKKIDDWDEQQKYLKLALKEIV
jgi:SPP1 family predicted phage head-tail adaptor